MATEAPPSSLELPDFDTLARLARDDPDAFESLRRTLVDDLIDHAPQAKRARLRGLQFRVDAVRKLAKSDLGSALKVYEMMWRSFRSLAREWNNLCDGAACAPLRSATPAAKVLPLRPRPH